MGERKWGRKCKWFENAKCGNLWDFWNGWFWVCNLKPFATVPDDLRTLKYELFASLPTAHSPDRLSRKLRRRPAAVMRGRRKSGDRRTLALAGTCWPVGVMGYGQMAKQLRLWGNQMVGNDFPSQKAQKMLTAYCVWASCFTSTAKGIPRHDDDSVRASAINMRERGEGT